MDVLQRGEMQDGELLTRYYQGDSEAFRVLLGRYQRPAYNFILRMVRQPDTAEDLCQDLFMRVLAKGTGFQQNSKFSTWMYSIARNLCLDHLRKMRHRRHASLDGGDQVSPLVERVARPEPDGDQAAQAGSLRSDIAGAVEALPDDQREVFLLRQLHSMPFQEIARIVEAPENTVKSRMRYALERLQKELARHAGDGKVIP